MQTSDVITYGGNYLYHIQGIPYIFLRFMGGFLLPDDAMTMRYYPPVCQKQYGLNPPTAQRTLAPTPVRSSHLFDSYYFFEIEQLDTAPPELDDPDALQGTQLAVDDLP